MPLLLLFVYLGLPLVALLLFSFAREWGGTVLPTEFTLKHWGTVLQNQDVLQATLRSLFVTLMVCVINWVTVIPAAYIAVVVAPKLRPLFHALAIAPFALPWIVIAAGIQLTVGEFAPQLFATVGLLVVAISAVTFPYLYWAVESSLITSNVKQLAEAAQMSGASWWQTMVQVVIPAARKGIMSGTLLVASSAFGEFAITLTLIGGAYETLPLWTLRMYSGRVPGAGTELAAVSFGIFMVLFALSMVLTRIDTEPSQPSLGGAQKLQSKRGEKR
ncbi:ABC transporter permease [Mycetocola sp.]|uniref:ABC transporter permease n=1 Tax=Mycetocola sp. TaxID=1871042 RepID=UPI00398A4DA2